MVIYSGFPLVMTTCYWTWWFSSCIYRFTHETWWFCHSSVNVYHRLPEGKWMVSYDEYGFIFDSYGINVNITLMLSFYSGHEWTISINHLAVVALSGAGYPQIGVQIIGYCPNYFVSHGIHELPLLSSTIKTWLTSTNMKNMKIIQWSREIPWVFMILTHPYTLWWTYKKLWKMAQSK